MNRTIIVIVLVLGWFFVRPAYLHHRCEVKTWENIKALPQSQWRDYDGLYKDCLHYWGQ